MNLDGARIYCDGVGIGHDCEEEILQIVNAIKSLSPSSEVSMRLLKSGHTYEGLLWGKANNIPIGVYSRCPSISHVLDMLSRRVKRECLKFWRLNRAQTKATRKNQIGNQSPLAIAG